MIHELYQLSAKEVRSSFRQRVLRHTSLYMALAVVVEGYCYDEKEMNQLDIWHAMRVLADRLGLRCVLNTRLVQLRRNLGKHDSRGYLDLRRCHGRLGDISVATVSAPTQKLSASNGGTQIRYFHFVQTGDGRVVLVIKWRDFY